MQKNLVTDWFPHKYPYPSQRGSVEIPKTRLLKGQTLKRSVKVTQHPGETVFAQRPYLQIITQLKQIFGFVKIFNGGNKAKPEYYNCFVLYCCDIAIQREFFQPFLPCTNCPPTPPPPPPKKNTVRPFSTDLSDEVARIDYQNRKTDFEEVSFITLNPGQTVSQVNES